MPTPFRCNRGLAMTHITSFGYGSTFKRTISGKKRTMKRGGAWNALGVMDLLSVTAMKPIAKAPETVQRRAWLATTFGFGGVRELTAIMSST